MNAIYDFAPRFTWDKTIGKDSAVLETVTDDISVVYLTVPGQMGVSARDFVNGRLKRTLTNGYVVVHNKIEYAPKPPSKDFVRGGNLDVGYLIEKVSEGLVRFMWFVQTELNGWVGFINVKSLTAQHLKNMLIQMRTHVKG